MLVLYALWILLELTLYALVIYTLYKIIWYPLKMLSMRMKLRKLGSKVNFERGLFDMIFGQKGEVDFTADTPNLKYEVSVISFISNHSRWNIEKTREGYCIEVRRANKFFFNVNKHSERPESVVDDHGDFKLIRSGLLLDPNDDLNTKKILLVYPRPKMLTYAHARLDVLYPGSVVAGYEIMYLEDLINELK